VDYAKRNQLPPTIHHSQNDTFSVAKIRLDIEQIATKLNIKLTGVRRWGCYSRNHTLYPEWECGASPRVYYFQARGSKETTFVHSTVKTGIGARLRRHTNSHNLTGTFFILEKANKDLPMKLDEFWEMMHFPSSIMSSNELN